MKRNLAMEVALTSKAPFYWSAKSARTVMVLSVMAILSGCSSLSDLDASDIDVLGIFDEGPPATTTTGQSDVRAAGDLESSAVNATPNLSSVPERPEAPTSPDVRQRVVEGLAADRENARYSDQSIRLQGDTRETVPAAPTTAPAPPQISGSSDRGAGTPTQIVPRERTQTASVTPPPLPVVTGRSPSVVVDTTAIDGGTSFPITATRVTIDEQVATIHFAHSSSNLNERDRRVIAQVASAQRENDADIIVVGHASERTQQLDKVDHELANFRISLARANRVATQLIAMGIAQEKVRVEAFADTSQVYSESMPTGEAGNRRADIYFRQ
jgi:outer membrane protein OmpA-like peptidoglycan-associated protein